MQRTTSTIPGFETDIEYDCTKWDDIRVPAHIQMEGYDAPQYMPMQYPWEGREEISRARPEAVQSDGLLCEIF